ncbi:hypothetical protein [Actinokineospora bangkokensis]|uniref:Uncharacterized protein n=1 Tax=Actinokineospora bangkokensis TaxID=1193682 RepID=A0A1Q9LK42_9PSEU|nr:hypothetical protein [Actinokineospora bangkokensis]OLR92364.1 hypothetical protein BJP25_19935 [Actinokineospora bangkokensis]
MGVTVVHILFPLLTVTAVALVQRRFGHRVGGVVVGLPLTMVPFLAALVVARGPAAAADAARGSMVGQVGVAVFCLVYAHLAHRRTRPPVALAATLGAVALTLAALSLLPPTWAAVPVALLGVGAALAALPAEPAAVPVRGTPWWDVPARAATSVGIVVTVAGSADVLGTHLAGLLATAPVLLSVITPPTHHRDGHPAAEALLHGTLRSVPATTLFAATVAFGLPLVAPG